MHRIRKPKENNDKNTLKMRKIPQDMMRCMEKTCEKLKCLDETNEGDMFGKQRG